MKELLDDIEEKLNIKISEDDIKVFSEGATEAIVFSINNEYLIKKTNKQELDVYNEFFSKYNGKRFQKLYYINYDLSYACLSFIQGNKYDNSIEVNRIINILYETTSNYKKIDYDGFGYLFEDHKTWTDFLKDEIDYSIELLDENKFDMDSINKALNIVSNNKIDKYLLHGDFGTHNFVINNNELFFIDPMGLVGDPLYDFFFAIYSDYHIFKDVSFNDLLKYFNVDLEYKKAIMYITFIIRMCRTYKYDREDFNYYLDYLNKFMS